MKLHDEDEETIRRYLLGMLQETEQQQLEERLLLEDGFVQTLELVEDELVEDYAFHRLGTDEERSFENHFLITPRRQQKLRLVQQLRRYADSQPAMKRAQPTTKKQVSRWETLFLSWWKPVAVAVIVLGVGGLLWRTLLSSSEVETGLAALNQAYHQQRPLEARITGLDYAPYEVTRGNDKNEANYRELEEAEVLLRKAAREKSNASSLHALGKLYLTKQEFDKAIEQLELALKTDPQNARLHSDLGVALILKLLNEASLQPRQINPSTVDQAFVHINKALELKPDMPEALFNRALLYESLNLEERARESWEAYLKKDSSSQWATEVRRKLEGLRKKTAETEVDHSESLYDELLAAYHNRKDAQAWQLYNENYLRYGNYVADKLLDNFLLSASKGREAEAQENLRTLEYLGKLAEGKTQDHFLRDLTAAYRSAGKAQRQALMQGRALRKSAYDLSLKAQHQEAIEACLAAQKLFTQAASAGESLLAEYWIAECYLRQSNQQKSLPAFTTLVQKCEQRNYRWLRALTFNRVAAVLGDQSEYSEALRYCQLAADEFSRLGDQSGYLRTLLNQASLYRYLGKQQEAINTCQESLALAKKVVAADASWASVLYAISGSSFYKLSLYTAALVFQKEALHLVEKLNRLQSISRYSVETGIIYSKLRDFDTAASYIKRGLEIGQQHELSPTNLDMLNYARLYLGQVLREMDKPMEALRELEPVAEFYRASGWEAQSYLVEKERLLNHIALDDVSAARPQLNVVLDLLEKHRKKILQQSNRNSFFDSEQSVYDIAVAFAENGLQQPWQAFTYSELSRARALLDAATVAHQIANDAALPEDVLSDSTRPLTFEEIQPNIPSDVQILQYAVLKDHAMVWVVTNKKLASQPIRCDPRELTEKIKTYITWLASHSRAEEEGQHLSNDLYQSLIRPIEPLLDKQRVLCIVPDKALNFLPFSALKSPITLRYLVEDYALLMAPSSTLFLRSTKAAAQKERLSREKLLVVGNPSFNHKVFHLPNLKSAAEEANAIAPLYDRAVSLIGQDAKKTALLREIEKADVVHLSMHYLPDPRSPMLSKLLLAAESEASTEAESTLALYEVYKLKLAQTRLVVLSACQTMGEEYYNVEGVMGLSRPFEAAGVPQVISSLWLIASDESKSLLVDLHTRRRKAGCSTIKALQEAQIAMLHSAEKGLRHPYYWAAFIVSGGYSQS